MFFLENKREVKTDHGEKTQENYAQNWFPLHRQNKIQSISNHSWSNVKFQQQNNNKSGEGSNKKGKPLCEIWRRLSQHAKAKVGRACTKPVSQDAHTHAPIEKHKGSTTGPVWTEPRSGPYTEQEKHSYRWSGHFSKPERTRHNTRALEGTAGPQRTGYSRREACSFHARTAPPGLEDPSQGARGRRNWFFDHRQKSVSDHST